MEIAGKKVTIIGGQRSGMALARLVVCLKGIAKISDQNREESLAQEFKEWATQYNVDLEFNGHTQKFVQDSDLVVISPGVRLDSAPIRWAKENNIPFLGEIEFAAQFCHKPIIAVTGSNGKTTVSTLISKVIENAGLKACLCGNVGFPFSDYVLNLEETDFVVLEVSSFQLESILGSDSPIRKKFDIQGFHPFIAVILNFSENHLDRHKDLQEYFMAKKRIILNQGPDDYLVLNYQDKETQKLATQSKSHVVCFNVPDENKILINPNHLAVLEVGRVLKIDESCCRAVFQEFKGVEHRLEKVRCLNGVDYINDSKATTAQSALWALENIEQPIVMICGGRDKNIDFTVLADKVRQKVKSMFVIGEARAKIRQAFSELVSLEECEGLEEAVVKAKENSSKGDCVLLSPMCASFDMFKDFEERGRIFKEIVQKLD